jgi:surface protein
MKFKFGMTLSRGFEPSLATGTLLATGGGAAPILPFLSTWNTEEPGTTNSQQVRLPLVDGGDYDFTVDWGDSSSDTINAWNQAEKTHTYNTPGIYTLNITGTINGWSFNNAGDPLKMGNVEAWGCLQPGNSGGYFWGCARLTSNATDALNITGTTNMQGMFEDCTLYNEDISAWNVASTTNMARMFANADTFNQSINGWNTHSVTNMDSMFSNMLTFNRDISGFNTHNVTNMTGMFLNTVAFDQDLSSWNTHNTVNMSAMFRGADAFNQSLTWNTSNVTDMQRMFYQCTLFNGDVGSWDVSKVTIMEGMFRQTSFNQDLSSWNTGNCESFALMFYLCTTLDQDFSSWDVASLTTAEQMFLSADALSTTNYSALLVGWAAQTVQNNVLMHGGDATANAAGVAARTDLTNNHTWTITDGGDA